MGWRDKYRGSSILAALLGGEPASFSRMLLAGAEAPQLIITPEIDLKVVAPTILIAAARPGYFFMPSRLVGCVPRKAGSLTTGPTLTGPLGITASGVTLFNAITFANAAPSIIGGAASNLTAVADGTDLTLAVTVGATGTGLTYIGRVGFIGSWVPS